ncbi:hypothetical protein BT96DRAFT_1087389 [Gymnopus androsaceus JB14]|uniref:CxC1-like cysteine cluster associated with KDZ transposases domain-containing protein n=1 Tax=Gymnopus androsaceus JB14 TaxID=1447944 RepID=A0A6A4GL52_9AGAR|nr:hypothetical protein BT96DRAFT_1087389 [Gymnopus androsaceus JB14]
MPVNEHDLPEDCGFVLHGGDGADGNSDWEDSDQDEGLTRTKEKMRKLMKRQYKDFRMHQDRTDKTWQNFAGQMDEMIVVYMDWDYVERKKVRSTREPVETLELDVVDMFGSSTQQVPILQGLSHDCSSIILAGLLPTTPLSHKTAITIHTISLYHCLFTRCPKLGIQPFMKALCNLEGLPFKLYLSMQMSIAFDVYVAILNGVCLRVLKTLGRDGPNWRMLNTCPRCQYCLQEEDKLDVRMLATFDGNDSLRRVEQTNDSKLDSSADNAGPALAPSREQFDCCIGGGDYFLSPAEVDECEEKNWGQVHSLEDISLTPAEQHLWAEGRCEERWHNAQDKNTARLVGRFMECGWFAFLCCHMMLLKCCNMIRSGEQSKYPLSMLCHYMSAEVEECRATGEGRPEGKLAISYNVHCKLSKTVKRSPLKNLAEWCNYLPVIGTMHGYAHKQECQLLFLMLYIVGTGIEDGEACEHYFNVTNALAGITCHQSIFHCRQAIVEFIYYHDNLETYAKSSLFIYNNYKQALSILQGRSAVAKGMREAGIDDTNTFYDWLAEEGEYLRNLSETPAKETLEMEYFLKLEGLNACAHDQGPAVERKVSHEMENERKLIADCQALEWKLEIDQWWLEGSEKWCAARKMVREASYWKALDKLEGLLVARMFEMTRLNVAGTGYKMRKHIANALKLRLKSIQTAIAAYNQVAAALSPPHSLVSWEDIVEFSYLSEFDILCDTREDVQEQRWATQKNCMLMQELFKLICTKNELPRLHLEIQRLLTYIRDEEHRLKTVADCLDASDPALALQRLDGFNFANNKHFWPGTLLKQQSGDAEAAEWVEGSVESDVEEEDDDDEIDGELNVALSIATDLE